MPQVQFLGHSCVTITEGEHRLIIDPFLTDNPQATVSADDINVNYVLITHGHGDHVGDGIAIAKRNDATVIASFELANMCAKEGCKIHPMHIGGKFNFDFGSVKLTIAHHGGGYGEDASRYTGPPVGFLVTIGGKLIYHAGDTGLFYDMKLIGEMNNIDLAFLPIGDNFTMGIDDAVKATEFLHAKKVVPFHYDTWPPIEAKPEEFAAKVTASDVVILKPGESLEL
jgi:L-ascorbate metabolism protein UlaG (beta-lactamase superfamily)